MAARANGGTSKAATRSSASTRPGRSSSASRSVRTTGSPLAARMARASAMVTSVRFSRRGISAPCLAYEMPEFWQQELVHGQTHSGFRAGHGHENLTSCDPCARPREHGRRAYVRVAQHPEQLTKAVDWFLEQPADDLESAIA